MMRSLHILFLLMLGVGMAVKPPRIVSARDSYLQEATFVDMGWTGSIVPGGPNYTFTGTAQEIISQIQEIDPNYVAPDATAISWDSVDANAALVSANPDAILTRQQAHTICRVAAPGPCPNRLAANEGVRYLAGLQGDCWLPPGPRVCARVSCSWNCGISWCNDNNHRVSWLCRDLTNNAQKTINECPYAEGVWGQTFDEQNFNVIVGYSPC
ncbi:hypothetical protein Micbo1qcDRAFT_205836 [Microdochium bolleyi]|uniref:Secreted protein n=1 Tax=Microdochium bolleyi TaxID=196109 RepID=A0A136IZ02_9PEZI|nr:hypothetical protein Micbo1qcDRAFT_205836 [Microdochium bolleyi]